MIDVILKFYGVPHVMSAILLYLLTEAGSNEDVAGSLQDGEKTLPASGMASVMAKILCRQVKSSKSVILSKCKTDRELSLRKRDERSSDCLELEPAKELQTTKVQRDLIIKVCVM